MDRSSADTPGPVPGAADGEVRQLGQDARRPDPRDVELERLGALVDRLGEEVLAAEARVPVDRVEVYRLANRTERVARESSTDAAADVLSAIGVSLCAAGFLLTLFALEAQGRR